MVMFILPPFQAFDLAVLSISIAAIWGVSAKDKLFHIADIFTYQKKLQLFTKADITQFNLTRKP
jgi:hypothetical protein